MILLISFDTSRRRPASSDAHPPTTHHENSLGGSREIALSFELGIWGNTLGPPRPALALEGLGEEAL